jgi:lauroyl/myristoyl acyltransferase
MALDLAPAGALETECLGRPLALARGPFALARMTGAPITPLAIRWTRRGTAVVIDIPLQSERLSDASTDPTCFELGLARAASRWLEAYLHQTPSELTLGLIRELLYQPDNPSGDNEQN